MLRTCSSFIFIFALCAVAAHGQAAAPEAAPLVSAGRSDCAIVFDDTNEFSARTAATLMGYIAEHTGVKPDAMTESELNADDAHKTLIVIDGSEDQKLLAKVNISVEVPADRADAYAMKVVREGARWIVAAAGRTPAGAKYATYRLMEEMRIDGRDASIAQLDVKASPFFPTRSVSLFNIWRVPVDVIRRCNLESWPTEKMQRSIDTYDAYGFNAIETHDRFHEDFLKTVYGITRAEWRDKVHAMSDRAHANGMTVFLRLWGNSVAAPQMQLKDGNTPFGFVNLTPDIPEERKRWETEIRDYASKNYAAHIDHLIGHWADAGGVHPGSKATVKDPMLLHNELVDAFRAINPKMQSSFNLWGMADPRGIRGWPGYEDHRSIVDAGILPKDVMIAQTTRSRSHKYSEKATSDIIAAGHPAAVWTWRRADTEVRLGDTGLRIRIHDLMGDYFNRLPESARQLQWHNIERNHHGISNDVNYYVAGKLMWDNKADVDVLLNKYCQLVFGDASAAAMAEAFNTIEAARHIERFVSEAFIARPADGARRSRAALDAIAKIKLPEGHRSRLPSVLTPQESLDELRETLEVIVENAQIMAGQLPALDALVKAGNSDEANAQAKVLRAKAQHWMDSIEGGVEGVWLQQTLKEKLAAPASAKSATSTPATKTQHGLLTRAVSVEPVADGDGFTLAADGDQPGVALVELKPPAAGPLEFRFRLKSVQPDGTRNGGFVFGPSPAQDDLTECQVFLRGKVLHIRGSGVDPVRREVPGIDPNGEHACIVRVDPSRKVVTFTVGETSIETTLTGEARPILYYGYTVERTKTEFGAIEIRPQP